jgi:hypothetical protein
VEPDLLNADPDPGPAFQVNPDPNPSFLKRERPASQKNELINFLLFLWVNLSPWIRIRIHNTGSTGFHGASGIFRTGLLIFVKTVLKSGIRQNS